MRTTAGTTVGTTVDVDGALALLQRVGPDYAWYADALRATAAAGAEEDLPDCALHAALQAALTDRRAALARNTFLYLRWKLETNERAADAAPRDAVAAERAAARARARAEARGRAAAEAAAAGARLIRDGEGRRWHVAEAGANGADGPETAGAERPGGLVFTSEGRRWHVPARPAAWRTCPESALAALLPTV